MQLHLTFRQLNQECRAFALIDYLVNFGNYFRRVWNKHVVTSHTLSKTQVEASARPPVCHWPPKKVAAAHSIRRIACARPRGSRRAGRGRSRIADWRIG